MAVSRALIPVLLAAASCCIAVPAAAATVPAPITVGGMFLQADWVVKAVMIGLLVASVVSWTVLIAKSLELRKISDLQRDQRNAVAGLRAMQDAATGPLATSPLLREAQEELTLSGDALADKEGVKERIVSRFERYEASVARDLTRGVTVLATIGSTAPFVGLFGTVWGIMNAFVGIAEKQTTNLAVVAPGIAEALLATALGLVAAIPAVVIYNHFSRQIAAHRA
ncbi:MAG: tonB-system energizer ExbB, partial [Croceibacterium sp.]